jgi:hypothetical protein
MFYCVAWLVFSTGCSSSLQIDWRVSRADTFPELQTPPNQVNNAIKLMARFHAHMILKLMKWQLPKTKSLRTPLSNAIKLALFRTIVFHGKWEK